MGNVHSAPRRLSPAPARARILSSPQESAQTQADAERRVEVIFDAAFESLMVLDDERGFLRVNEAAASLLAAGRDELLQMRLDDVTPPMYLDRLEDFWRNLQRRGAYVGRYDFQRGDGSRGVAEIRARWHYASARHLIAARELVGPIPSTRRPRKHSPLTAREIGILQLVAEGCSNPQIGQTLHLSPATVKIHLEHVYAKLDVTNRASAVAIGLRTGQIE